MRELTEGLERHAASAGIPAVSLTVHRRGQPLLRHAWGLVDPQSRTVATAATRFRVGCLTKPVVAVAVLLLSLIHI